MNFPYAVLLVAACLFAPLSGRAASASPPARPNIIFILADDYGVGEVGCYGADNYQTPQIDALAAGGIRFTHGYTVSLCGPSRAQILTGRYGFRTGGTNQDAVGRFTPAEQKLIPATLKSAGYASSMIGKWSQFPLTPADFGFDDYLQYKGSGIYWNTQAKGKTYVVNGETKDLPDGEYMPDLMHRHLVDFITARRESPFYVHYSLSHTHNEILRTPDSPPDSQTLYADNVAYLDKLVGRLIAELERLNLREKTLVIFMGDNGTASVQAARATIGGRRLDGAKGSMREGGGRVPLIASWPGTVAPGQVSDELVDSTDFFPTFAELAGAALPSDRFLDGRSLAPRLKGNAPAPRTWIFHQLARNWYVRDAAWKLNQAGELFDMGDAPFGEKLVASDTADPVALAARKRLQAVLDELNPAGGIPDTGDPSGRHASNIEKKKKAKKDAGPTKTESEE